MFEFLFQPQYTPMILQGLSLTVEITLFGVLLGLGLGTLLAIGDIYGGKPAKGAIAVYVEIFRGSPLFVQLFLAVYTVPAILNLQIDHYHFGFLGFRIKQRRLPERLHEGRNGNHTWRSNAGRFVYGNVKNPNASPCDFAASLPNCYSILDQRVLFFDKKHGHALAYVGLFDLVSAGIVHQGNHLSDSSCLDRDWSYLFCVDNRVCQSDGYDL